MTLRSLLLSKARTDLDALDRFATAGLVDVDQVPDVRADVKALRLALQQWEALVRALQRDGRPQHYAVDNVLGDSVAEQHRRVQALVSRLELIHGVSQAVAQ